jgi:hypothetical protein
VAVAAFEQQQLTQIEIYCFLSFFLSLSKTENQRQNKEDDKQIKNKRKMGANFFVLIFLSPNPTRTQRDSPLTVALTTRINDDTITRSRNMLKQIITMLEHWRK